MHASKKPQSTHFAPEFLAEKKKKKNTKGSFTSKDQPIYEVGTTTGKKISDY
jgi:hypothetical protein